MDKKEIALKLAVAVLEGCTFEPGLRPDIHDGKAIGDFAVEVFNAIYEKLNIEDDEDFIAQHA